MASRVIETSAGLDCGCCGPPARVPARSRAPLCRGATLTAVLLLVAAAPARAEKPSEARPPSCLDQSIKNEVGEEVRPRGVQKRVFLKRGDLELVLRGGLFAADLLSSSYAFGGALAYFPTEDFGLEIGFDVTPLSLDIDTPLADFFGDDRFENGTGYVGMASLLWAPIHAKLKVGGGIVHSDILFAAGAGRVFHDSVQGISFNGGTIVELLTTHWLTLRFEVRDIIAVQEAVTETRLTNNIMVTLGLAFWIPTPL